MDLSTLSAPIGGPKNEAIRASLNGCRSTAAVSSSGTSFQSDCGGLTGELNFGSIHNRWVQPAITISGGNFQTVGGITGSCCDGGTVTGCADLTGSKRPVTEHRGAAKNKPASEESQGDGLVLKRRREKKIK